MDLPRNLAAKAKRGKNKTAKKKPNEKKSKEPKNDMEMEEGPTNPKVWQPGDPIEEGEELDFDPSAYHCLDRFQTDWPCLSFDFLGDNLGSNRSDFPHTLFIVAGTQAESMGDNYITVMKLRNLGRLKTPNQTTALKNKETKGNADDKMDEDGDDQMEEAATLDDDENEEDDDNDSDNDDDDDDVDAGEGGSVMHHRRIRHFGGVNRVRCMPQKPEVVAVWGERESVQVFDLSKHLNEIAEEKDPLPRVANKLQHTKPIFSKKHMAEGFALDWSRIKEGVLASGDCRKNLHVWNPRESGWDVSNPLRGHTKSVEDIQWSPSEETVLATGSVDRTVRIWDTRNSGGPMITVNAHEADVNVLSWSSVVTYMLASGGDDGVMRIWDLRSIKDQNHVAQFKFHKDAVTSIEWSPHEGSMLATCGADNQLAVWDLALERDPEEEAELAPESNATVDQEIPPQLLFLHGGQTDMKELHWHKQIPGMIGSTAGDGFNVFKAANV